MNKEKTIDVEVVDNLPVESSQSLQNVTPSRLLELAISQGAGIDQLEKLLLLQERFEANEARKLYNAAISKFKAENIEIVKTAEVDFTNKAGVRTNYKHATLAGVISQIIEAMSKYNLSHSWSVEQTDCIKVTCKISHVGGHSETVSMSAAKDDTGGKNQIQQIGSTVTYLQRYTLKAALGLAEADDDGKASEWGPQDYEKVSEDQAERIRDALVSSGKKEKGLCVALSNFDKAPQISCIEDIPASWFKATIELIKKEQK